MGFDETIAFADLATGVPYAGPGGVCYADSPGGVLEFSAEGVLIELAPYGEPDRSCFVRFEGTFADCAIITFGPDGAPIHSIVLEGVGEFYNTSHRSLETLYLMIQERQDDE